MILQALALIFWLAAVPFCIGLLPVRLMDKRMRTPGVVLLAGYFAIFPLFMVITIPAVILIRYENFLFVLRWFTAAALTLGLAGALSAVVSVRRRRRLGIWERTGRRETDLEEKLEWALVLALLAFQLYMAVTKMSFDGDDAYYVAQSRIAQQSNVMYTILPYTGSTTALDIRHSLAVFPMWIAYIGAMSGVHSTIVAHTVLPLLLIPLTYLIYLEIGKRLFRKNPGNLPVFMVFMELLQIFGNVSIYTPETFFLTRTWQGKSMIGNFAVPALIWLLLELSDRGGDEEPPRRQTGLWVLLTLVNISAGIFSSMGVMLCAMLVAIAAFLMALRERKFGILVKAGLTCVPSAVYSLMYLLLK